MAFQLNIRHNIENAESVFGRGTVTTFDERTVSVGRSLSCECRIDSDAFEDEHFRIEYDASDHSAVLVSSPNADVFVNDAPVSGRRRLLNGDDIRVGHWSLRFQKLFPKTGRATHTSWLAGLAKVLIAAILFSELFLVIWLPRKMRDVGLWRSEVAKQRVSVLLDSLRRRNRDAAPASDFERAAREVLRQELDSRARYLRRYDDVLVSSQRETMYEDLVRLGGILDRLDAGSLVEPVSAVEIDQGVRTLLEMHTEK